MTTEELIERVYAAFDGSSLMEEFHERHEIDSMLILTVASQYGAKAEVQKLIPDIEGRTVVEIGAGVGLLAMEIAQHAKHVWAIEADPAWNFVFTKTLYALKPPNLTWVFGNAKSMIGLIHADVAVIYTRSDIKGMAAIAAQMAPRVVRGPLVEFEERYGEFMTPEQLEFAQEIATEAMLTSDISRRGMNAEALRNIEHRFLERFPDAKVPA